MYCKDKIVRPSSTYFYLCRTNQSVRMFPFILTTFAIIVSLSVINPNIFENRSVIVHLFEWKFKDIALECENFLGPNGYAGVQVSPVQENVIVENRPWWERYQPISYKLSTRSGDINDLRNMIERCNKMGIRIYVDVVFNHMCGDHLKIIGTGGSTANVSAFSYPSVPYTKIDFHNVCSIHNYNNASEVRNCELEGMPDLNQKIPEVIDRITHFMNELISFGVAGFRIDAAKHMWPNDLKKIYSKVNNLSTLHRFSLNQRPFIFQEVIDLGGEAIKKSEYSGIGIVTEFKYSAELSKAFRGENSLKWLKSWGPDWGFLPSKDSLVFVDNHDIQRTNLNILTYKNPRNYKMAIAFMLSHPYGNPRIMSSFDFNNKDDGPPTSNNEEILSPEFDADGNCKNKWVCEHRWKEISRMVGFRNIVSGTNLTGWWEGNDNQIAFCRGNKGFIVFNNDITELRSVIETCLPSGLYCDIASGSIINGICTGEIIEVTANGNADIKLTTLKGFLAIHIKEIVKD